MEVKPGYKHTQVGVIPQDWDETRLGADITLLSGHHILASNCNTQGVGVPYITGPADFPDGLISHTKFTERPSTICEPGDILVTVKGSGAGSLVLADASYCISRQLMAIRVSDWDKHFVFYSLLHNATQFKAASTGLIPGLSRADVQDQLLPLPKPPEQRAISEALSDVDGLLDRLDRLVTKKRDLKQAAMQQLLTGKVRLPGFHGEWEETTLGVIGECVIGLTYKPENVAKHGLLVLRSSNIQDGRLAFDDNIYVNVPVADHLKTRIGDLLICVRNGSQALIGKSALIDDSVVGSSFGAFMSVYRTKHWRFIAHVFRSSSIQRQIRDNIGATIGSSLIQVGDLARTSPAMR